MNNFDDFFIKKLIAKNNKFKILFKTLSKEESNTWIKNNLGSITNYLNQPNFNDHIEDRNCNVFFSLLKIDRIEENYFFSFINKKCKHFDNFLKNNYANKNLLIDDRFSKINKRIQDLKFQKEIDLIKKIENNNINYYFVFKNIHLEIFEIYLNLFINKYPNKTVAFIEIEKQNMYFANLENDNRKKFLNLLNKLLKCDLIIFIFRPFASFNKQFFEIISMIMKNCKKFFVASPIEVNKLKDYFLRNNLNNKHLFIKYWFDKFENLLK